MPTSSLAEDEEKFKLKSEWGTKKKKSRWKALYDEDFLISQDWELPSGKIFLLDDAKEYCEGVGGEWGGKEKV